MFPLALTPRARVGPGRGPPGRSRDDSLGNSKKGKKINARFLHMCPLRIILITLSLQAGTCARPYGCGASLVYSDPQVTVQAGTSTRTRGGGAGCWCQMPARICFCTWWSPSSCNCRLSTTSWK